jgi:hypothetical protein
VDVTVLTACGTSATSPADKFSYQPVVTGISPARGTGAGGTQVTITGAGFNLPTTVYFGVTAAASFHLDSDSQITAVSPAGTGTVDVTVVTTGGTSVKSVADQFSYAPVVTGINPANGPDAGGTQVTITGVNFTSATAVYFGATAAASFHFDSDTQITAVSPAGTRTVDVTVVTTGGTSVKSVADQFSYAPVVTGISPALGPATGGTQVTITGAGFTGATAVNFGNTPATSFSVVSDNQITATSPAGAGTVDVTVVTAGGTSATSSADEFIYGLAVTGLTPTLGSPAGGTQVTITGGGFTGATAVHFGSTEASTFTVNSDTQITATSPAGTGVVDVTVTVATATSAKSSVDQFSYAPVVTEINPGNGLSAGGTQVTITGVNFTGATAVYFGTTKATAVTVDNDGEIKATSPAGAGVVDVTVVTPGGTSAKSVADQFSYAPVVTAINPANGPDAGGIQVTITGAGFTGATAVNFGKTSAQSFTVVSDTQITAVSPAGTGTVDVTVVSTGGTSATSSADQFDYAPAVTAISPSTGLANGKTQVTITGVGFTDATAVSFGKTSAQSFTVVSDTQITAVTGGGTGLVDVTVATKNGTSATSSADQFSYTPVVTAVNPASGLAAGGTQVTITGVGFTGATAVHFGTAAASFTVLSDTQITAASPPGTGQVEITVTTAGGTSATGSVGDEFDYSGIPAITAISATSGPTTGGTTVTITGTNLADATAVKFGNSTATIQNKTATQIVVTAPAGTGGTVDVTVVAAAGTSAIGPADQFTYYVPGICAIGLYNPSTSIFALRDCNTAGYATGTFLYGAAGNGFISIVGDWNGDGTDTIGLYNPVTSVFYLSNSNTSQVADITFVYGPANSGDIPIAGDWNADGKDTVGLYDPKTSTFYLRNSNSSGFADISFVYGPANGGLTPIAGDWYGGGKDTIGLYSPTTSTFYLRNSNTSGLANVTFAYGPAHSGWTPVVGDWDGDGKDSIGLYNPTASVFYLRNSNEGGYADMTFTYGAPNNGSKPVVGYWMGDAKALMAAEQGGDPASVSSLTQAQLAPIVNEAIAQWSGAGLSAADVQKLRQAQFVITDLPGSYLGEAQGNVVSLDVNAAGNGWFVDPTPAQNEEFASSTGTQQLRAVDAQALDHIDLLTVVEHELGHVLGLNDLNALADDVMDGVLGTGVRRLVTHVDAVLAS